jgi:two-component system, OmpR family, sensor kinase
MLDSVRTRLTLWYVAVLAIILIAFAAWTYFRVVSVLGEETDENMEAMVSNFKSSLETETAEAASKENPEEIIYGTIEESRFQDYNFAVYDSANRKIGATFENEELNTALLKLNEAPQEFTTVYIRENPVRIRSIPLDYGARKYRLYVTHSLQDQTRFMQRLQSIYLVIVPLALLLTGLSGYFLARKSLAPVTDMSRRAENLSATNLHERLPVKNEKDELGNLARVFNALLSRLENSFEQQRRFMADASHELRTPLAIVRGESEVSLAKSNRPAEEYRESLAIVSDESKRLTHIVEDLFTLARADAGEFRANFADLYLDELLTDCVRAVRVLADEQNIKLTFVVTEEMPLRADEQLLRRLFINLLDNAIKYNRKGGAVTIIAEKNASDYQIKISDTGYGVAGDEQPKIFDRFYRADKARSRTIETTTSGAGLGLSIAAWIAELHHGTIKLSSSTQKGSSFTVTLPQANS